MARIGLRLPTEEKEHLMSLAREENTTLSHLIRQIITAETKRRKEEDYECQQRLRQRQAQYDAGTWRDDQ